jgi:hypothetical protein
VPPVSRGGEYLYDVIEVPISNSLSTERTIASLPTVFGFLATLPDAMLRAGPR